MLRLAQEQYNHDFAAIVALFLVLKIFISNLCFSSIVLQEWCLVQRGEEEYRVLNDISATPNTAWVPKSPLRSCPLRRCRCATANPGRHEGHAIMKPLPKTQTRSATTTTTLYSSYHIIHAGLKDHAGCKSIEGKEG